MALVKEKWILDDDHNTKYYHNLIIIHRNINRIHIQVDGK